ncbi:type VI secretion system Vgr family protein [Caballeronia sp. GAFFF1]|uniref:type VI secretion system Vgr family protein n=1 Tax=Caballeronia sp. GAFFF1 TaxID=2921779 RepID=UPI002028FE28|nr:type VI secretion system Vgr family protein [Caballeronia sp. GAFFF1]
METNIQTSWFTQPRTLDLSGASLPRFAGKPLFAVARVRGSEELGRLYEYDVDLVTIDDPRLLASDVHALVDLDSLIGKEVTLSIAVEGNGTWVQGQAGNEDCRNIGADVRRITGLVTAAECVGSNERRARYSLKVRPWLFISTLNQDSRIWLGQDIVQITQDVLDAYPFPYELRLAGPGGGGAYPKRDYQRQYWESDFALLDRLWQEWGITYFFDGITLVLCDSPAAFRKHGPAYETVRYLDRNAQRIDEEHIHEFRVARQLTTGRVSLVDYDYTRSLAKLTAQQSDHSERVFDNAEHYGWGDYSQPLADAMGIYGEPNDYKCEAEHLARIKVDANRCQSLRAKGKGNLRGLMTGHTFHLRDYPLKPGDGEYLVISTEMEIVNNDTVTQNSVAVQQYTCETSFTAQPANVFYRTPQTAKKPRAFSETAMVTGYGDEPIWTDAFGRVKVHFVWDRRREKDQAASCWLQVASPWQGQNHGAVWVPRVGHMVSVGYHDSDPDRPYVSCEHTTEFHQLPWALPKNDALSGWRSQELNGASANSIVTDDTPGKLQVQVASDHAQSRLVLGYNTRIDGHAGRKEARGEGFELATEAHGVVRANKGLLVTTESRNGASAPAKAMEEPVLRLTEASAQHQTLHELGVRHKAHQQLGHLDDIASAIGTQVSAICGAAADLPGRLPELARPDFVLASSAGIATTATESTHIASQQDHAVTAGRDVSLSSGRSFFASIRGAISMFAQQLGIRLVAAKGNVEIQSQRDQIALTALKDVAVTSVNGKVVITASEEVWIGAGGSYIRINGTGIVNGSPGAILEKAAVWSKEAADGADQQTQTFFESQSERQYSQQIRVDETTLGPYNDKLVKYYFQNEAGENLGVGNLDKQGSTLRIFTDSPTKIKSVLDVANGKWSVLKFSEPFIFEENRTDHPEAAVFDYDDHDECF